jgi:hypothetical protein
VRLTSGGARTYVFVGQLRGEVARIKLGRVESVPLAKVGPPSIKLGETWRLAST